MNKAKYVEKMTDLVESTLLDMGVSPYFTIEDGWEEDEELEMTLTHDANDHDITFNLAALYQQKKEEDIKVKDQYRDNLKDRVVSFVERENELGLDNGHEYDDDEYDEDFDEDEEYEEDDYDDEDEEYDEDFDEDDEDEELDDDFDDEDFDDEEEEDDIEEEAPVSSSISNYFTPLKFTAVNDNPNVMVATLPIDYEGDVTKIARRYGKQISELFEGSFVVKPNKKDVLVLSSEEFDIDEVYEILEELYEEGGDKAVEEIPNESKER